MVNGSASSSAVNSGSPSKTPDASGPPSDDGPLWAAVAGVNDPEMPPLTIADLGILRSVEESGDTVRVTITPTYSGCPAIDMIESGIVDAVAATGVDRQKVEVKRVLAPAWTTDWITEEGHRKLLEAGISPPRPLSAVAGEVRVRIDHSAAHGSGVQPVGIVCPQCGSDSVVELSRFGSTACKALYRCESCREPFNHIKEL